MGLPDGTVVVEANRTKKERMTMYESCGRGRKGKLQSVKRLLSG